MLYNLLFEFILFFEFILGLTGIQSIYHQISEYLYLQGLDLIIRNLDHSVLPFDLAQGGEPVEPFRILTANLFLREPLVLVGDDFEQILGCHCCTGQINFRFW